jgi:hypothetical protein
VGSQPRGDHPVEQAVVEDAAQSDYQGRVAADGVPRARSTGRGGVRDDRAGGIRARAVSGSRSRSPGRSLR